MKSCDHPVVMCHFATRNWNTYTNQTTRLMCYSNFKNTFWNVLQWRAVKNHCYNAAVLFLISHKHAAMPKSLHIHDKKWKKKKKFNNRVWWSRVNKDVLIWLGRQFNHKSIAHFHLLPKGQWWYYQWNGMRCLKLPPAGISWCCGDQYTHFLAQT